MTDGGTPWDHSLPGGKVSPSGILAVETLCWIQERRESGTAILKGVGVGSAIVSAWVCYKNL